MSAAVILLIVAASALAAVLLLELCLRPLLPRLESRATHAPDDADPGRERRARSRAATIRQALARTRSPARLLVPLLAARIALGSLQFSAADARLTRHLLEAPLVYSFAWLGIRLTYLVDDSLLHRYQLDAADNLRARRLQTQVVLLRRLVAVGLVVLATGIVLLSFSTVRAVGTSLLASAGIVGIVAGIAAQSTLSNLIAGLQLAFTQPFRVDDVLVIQGEWGKVEEITLSYVVLGLWDRRRLVLPISYFTTNSFENWTRSTSALTGTVDFEVDFSAPIGRIRERLQEILAASTLWDGLAGLLQVTDANGATMHVRALVTAVDAPTLFDLRCEVREQLLGWIAEQLPEALPRIRTAAATPTPRLEDFALAIR